MTSWKPREEGAKVRDLEVGRDLLTVLGLEREGLAEMLVKSRLGSIEERDRE